MLGFREKYIRSKTVSTEHNIHRQIEPGVYIYMKSFSNNVGRPFTLEKFEDGKLKEKLTARSISWKEDSQKWVINNYWKRVIYEDHEDLSKGYQIDTTLSMTPQDFLVMKDEMETYTTPDLLKEIKLMKMRGINYVEWELEKHRRIANPFSTFILTVIGMSLASRKIKGGLGLHLGLGLLLAFSYILFMQISTVFAISGSTPPFVAIWIPNLCYTVIAFFVYRWAAK